MPKITELEIRNYRGIKVAQIAVAPSGAIIKGRNASGKTSILKAIGAALAAQDIGPDAIHLGDDQAEIIVNLDALRVRRSITAKGSSLVVTNDEGDRWSRPQTRLNELLGTCALDPLSFFLADAKERKRQVLEAIPLEVTAADLQRWGVDGGNAVDTSGHGLEVLERLRTLYYKARTDANRVLAEARAKAESALVAASAAAVPHDPALPPLDAATAEVTAAERRFRDVEARRAVAAQARAASEGSRRRVEELRRQAEALLLGSDFDNAAELAELEKILDAASMRVGELERQLAQAKTVEKAAREDVMAARRADAQAQAQRAKAAAVTSQANELEASLASIDAMDVSDDSWTAANEAFAKAVAQHARVFEAEKAAKLAAAAQEANTEVNRAAAAHEALDAVVATLTHVAPKDLTERSEMIPGLTFGDAGILLDGVAVDHLSGAEQMRFAIDLARRANEKARILVVDGLERLDEERLRAFIAYATRDGWQLIGTRVHAGGMVIEAIEADAPAAAEAAE